MKVCLSGLVLLGIALSVSAFFPFPEDDNSISDVEPKIPENPSHMNKMREKRGLKKKRRPPPGATGIVINSWSVDDVIPFTEYDGKAVHKMVKAEEVRERREVEAPTDTIPTQQAPDISTDDIKTEEATTAKEAATIPKPGKVKRQIDPMTHAKTFQDKLG